MDNWTLTGQQVEQFAADGYLMLEDYFPRGDIDLLLKVARADQKLAAGAADRHDSEGRVSRLSLRSNLPDDLYSAFVRNPRVVGPMEQLLGEEVYHYHHKMMLKEPFTGGAWEWHQDYGYWYKQFLFADMASCMIAVDRATKENGCLQVLKGSHRLGRLEHGITGDQTGADMERIRAVEDKFERVYCEMAPGTALFFHSNLLHRSDANDSPMARWSLICCYTAASNTPFVEGTSGTFAPLERWDDDKLRAVGAQHRAAVLAADGG
ncbi:MAG: phytanoyl-CoA dioxygenase family protein [Candidatus Latescibacteria bacterium]|nr:phytanoyl-CoA dioxygenase family protein [Candidatus Latescibacterota bacterium]